MKLNLHNTHKHTLMKKTKSELAEMYFDSVADGIKLADAARTVIQHEQEYRMLNLLGPIAPECFKTLASLIEDKEK